MKHQINIGKTSSSSKNDIGAIGRSFIENVNYKTPNTEELERSIINNAKKFYEIT